MRNNLRWTRILAICFMVNVIGFASQQIISFAITTNMQKELQMTASMLGVISGIFSIGALFLQVKTSDLANKSKSKGIITILLLLSSFFNIAQGFSTSGMQLLIFRFFTGFTGGGLCSALTVIITNWFPEKERGKAFSNFFLSNGLTMVLMGPIVGIIAEKFGWRMLFYSLGVLNIIIAIIWFVFITEKPEDAIWLSEEERIHILGDNKNIKKKENLKEKEEVKISIFDIIKDRNIIKICIIICLFNLGMFGFGLWLPSLLGQISNSGLKTIGWLSVAPNIIVMIGLEVWGYISSKSNKIRLLTALPMFGFGILLAIGTFVNIVWINYIIICMASFFLQNAIIGINILPSKVVRNDIEGYVRGFINTFGAVGGFIGPWIVGIIKNITQSTNISMLAVTIALVIGGILCLTLPKEVDKFN